MNASAGHAERVVEEIQRHGFDSLLVTDETNVRYLTGFIGHDALVVLTRKKKFFLTDSRYAQDAADTIKDHEIILIKETAYTTLKRLFQKIGVKKTGFESLHLPYEVFKKISRFAQGKLIPAGKLVESVRAVKDAGEIAAIRNAIRLTRTVMRAAARRVRDGASERAVAAHIEIEFLKQDAHPGFEPIVSYGKNSARPHAHPGAARPKKGDAIMIDIGAALHGYCADMTESFFFGEPRSPSLKKAYRVVEDAQRAALDKVRPGRRVSEIDFAARAHIARQGYGRYFGHALGHGVGMRVHEEPSINRFSKDVVREGMVFTIEPAIYLPADGGVRIEDMVRVTKSGCEVMTRGG